MGAGHLIRRLAIILIAACAAHLAPVGRSAFAQGGPFSPDCTDPAVNAYLRDNLKKGRTQSGELVANTATLTLQGTMGPVARNGAKLTCSAKIRVSVGGRSAIRSTTVSLTIRGGQILNISFIMAPNL